MPTRTEEYLCVADAEAATIGTGVDYLRTSYYFDPSGDDNKRVGGARYRRFGSIQPSHALALKSADDIWWEIAPETDFVEIEQAGWYFGRTLLDNMKAINRTINFCKSRALITQFPAGEVAIDGRKGSHDIYDPDDMGGIEAAGGNCHLRGKGIGATILKNVVDEWHCVIACRSGPSLFIEELTVDGGWPELAPAPGATVRGEGVILFVGYQPLDNFNVRNVRVQNTAHYGIGAQNIVVKNMLIDGLEGENIGGDLVDLKDNSNATWGTTKWGGSISNVRSLSHGMNPDHNRQAALDIRGQAFELSNIFVRVSSVPGQIGNDGIRFNADVVDQQRFGGRRGKLSNFIVECPLAVEDRSATSGACRGVFAGDYEVCISNGSVEGCYVGIEVSPSGDSVARDVAITGVVVNDARGADGGGTGFKFKTPVSGVELSGVANDCDIGLSSTIAGLNGSIVLKNSTIGHNLSIDALTQSNVTFTYLANQQNCLHTLSKLPPEYREYVVENPWLQSRTIGIDGNWQSVCWSPDLALFCAVGPTGATPQVMTSPDGVNWTAQAAAAALDWRSVCWSSSLGLFCAVASSGTGGRVMTSPDGINWAQRSSANDNAWRCVIWVEELGLFIAVATTGPDNNRVMTSPDGLAWTQRATPAANAWYSVAWSPLAGVLVAVSNTGTNNRAMVSNDGISWFVRPTPADNKWQSICYAAGSQLFVACSVDGSDDRIMTSPNGATWTLRSGIPNNAWSNVCYSPELDLLVAVATTGTANQVLTSNDGENWTLGVTQADQTWRSICWSPDLAMFVAVADNGSGSRVMTSVQATGVSTGERRGGVASEAIISSDANITLQTLIDPPVIRHTGTLTANRTVTLSSLNAQSGNDFRIVRTGSGAFSLSVAGKALAQNQWADFSYGAGGWYLAAAGSL